MIHGCVLDKLYVYLSCAGSHTGGQVAGVNEVPYFQYSPISQNIWPQLFKGWITLSTG